MQKPTILVVDDSPLILRILSTILQKSGYSVVTAQDGEEALHKVQDVHPALIFLDVMMPKKSGYEVAQAIRSRNDVPQPYIIMLTALDHDVDVEQARRVGVDEFMPKPFNPSQIAQRVADLLKTRV